MKIVLISALAASAFVTSVSPTFAQKAAHESPFQAFALDPNGPIVPNSAAQTPSPAIVAPATRGERPYHALIASHAASNGIPAELVHRVIVRESRYRANAMGRGGATGLMQIKLSTARAMGYSGSAAGLRDPATNLTYGVRYLAGAYRAANGHHGRAVGYYASGYYYAAKRQRARAKSYAKTLPAASARHARGAPQDAARQTLVASD
jgi:soluble lytic murein transglycosylase-like protein